MDELFEEVRSLDKRIRRLSKSMKEGLSAVEPSMKKIVSRELNRIARSIQSQVFVVDVKVNRVDAKVDVNQAALQGSLNTGTLVLLSTTTVALNANAETTIFTVPTGVRCILSHALIVLGADAGTTDLSIGQNGAETDFVGAIDLALLNAEFDVGRLAPIPVAAAASCALEKSYAAGTLIRATVTNQAGGATNTLYLFGTLY